MIEEFEPRRIFVPELGRHNRFQSIVCGECGKTENFIISKRKPLPSTIMVKKGQHMGWVMGNRRKDDLCPKCVAKAAAKNTTKKVEKPLRFEPIVDVPKVITMPMPQAQPAKEPEMTAEIIPAPRQPSREDKRLIILEIENHYLGPDKGYSPGATDETVAKSLNVPVRWVVDLREEFFGPLVNPEFAKIAAELGKLTERLDAYEREGRELRAKLMDLKERFAKASGGAR